MPHQGDVEAQGHTVTKGQSWGFNGGPWFPDRRPWLGPLKTVA